MSNEREGSNVARETSGPVSALTPDFMAGWSAGKCGQCGGEFMYRAEKAPALCRSCSELNRDHESNTRLSKVVSDNLRDFASRWLKAAGLSDREIGAVEKLIPPPLAARLAPHTNHGIEAAEAGVVPRVGFGITGDVGRGKTFALVCYFKRLLMARWGARISIDGERAMNRWLSWRRWPETAARMRVLAAGADDGYTAAEKEMNRLSRVDALVLDDLGGERLRGAYEEDWVTSMLDLLIDRRYNDMKPTWYTTNLSRDEFAERYGARMFSRLCAENRMIVVPSGPDLRIVNDARTVQN